MVWKTLNALDLNGKVTWKRMFNQEERRGFDKAAEADLLDDV